MSVLHIFAGQLAVAVDMDCVNAEVYWTDAAAGLIRKVALNGSDSQVILTGICSSSFVKPLQTTYSVHGLLV